MGASMSAPTPINRIGSKIAVEFNGLAPAVAGALPSAAAADHAHPVNALGRVVQGFGIAAECVLTGQENGQGGFIVATADALPSMTAWTVEFWAWMATNVDPSQPGGIMAGFLGPFDVGGGPAFNAGDVIADLVGIAGGEGGQSLYNAGSAVGSGSVLIAVNTPTHIAVSSDGTTMRAFQDGTLKATAPAPAAVDGPAGVAYVVNYADNTVWLDEFRVSDVCRYTDDFTPAQEPFVPDEATVVLWHFDDIPLGTEISANYNVPSGQSFTAYTNLSADSSGNGHTAGFYAGGYASGGGSPVGTATFGGEVSTVTTSSGVGAAYSVLSLQARRGDLILTDTSGNPIATPVAQPDGTTQLQMQPSTSPWASVPYWLARVD